MGKYLSIGNDGFAAIVKGLYVDKTELIAYINSTIGTKDKLTCVSRPRRFGKSYAAQTLCAYYDRSCDSAPLFSGLRISGDPSFREHLNRYDVIYLDITLFLSEAEDIHGVVRDINDKVVKELRLAYPDVKTDGSLAGTLYSIAEAAGSKFIVIIDEWDALFRESKEDAELQKDYLRLLRGMFKSSLTDKMIAAAYMTGILPIKKYGTQSAMTDFREYTMLQPEPLEEFMGFTEEEVRCLCSDSGLDFTEVQRWYDGYLLGDNVPIYSPKSVIDAVRRKRLGSYWTQSETYESLRFYIDLDEDGLKEAIVQMLGGAHIKIDAGTFQNDMTSIRQRDDVLTLLVHLGYLTYEADERAVFIPNEEVRQEFVRTVASGKRRELARMIRSSEHLLEQTLNGEEEAVAAAIEEAHSAGTAPAFYNNEQALRSVIRFAYLSCVDEFMQIQELPSGKGYADIVFLPKKGSSKPALLVELKWNRTAEGAIRQIREKRYPQVLETYGGEILLVGVSYDAKSGKHDCRIEKHVKAL